MYVDTIILFFLWDSSIVCGPLLQTPGIINDLRTVLSQQFSEDTLLEGDQGGGWGQENLDDRKENCWHQQYDLQKYQWSTDWDF